MKQNKGDMFVTLFRMTGLKINNRHIQHFIDWRLRKQGTRAQEVGTQKEEESKNQLRRQIFCLCYTSTQLLVGESNVN